MAKPSYETLQKKAARLEKELNRVRLSQRRNEVDQRDLVENVNSIILRLDTKGKIIFINDYALKFFGYSADEITGQSVIGTIVPENESTGRDLAGMMEDICAHPERYTSNENENMKKDGTVVWVSWSNRALTDQSGAVTEIICVGNDITRLKKAEEAARESEEKYRALYDSSINIMYIHDLSGNFIDANEAGLKLIGYTREELKTLTFMDILPPDQAQKAFEKTAEIIAAGHSIETVEYRLRAKNGEEKYLEVSASPLYHHGEPYGILGIAHDTTSTKMAAAAIRESEEKFSTAFSKSPLLTAINTIEDNRFIDVNDRFLEVTGFQRDEVIGKTIAEINLSPNIEEQQAIAAEVLETGSVRDKKLRIRTKSGDLRWGLFTGEIISLGQKKYLLTMMNDVTERNMAEEELKKNEAVLRSMLEAVPVGVGLLVDRKFSKVNPSLCSITGFSDSEMIGKDTRMLYPDDDEYARVGRELYGQMEREGLGMQEARLRRKDGSLIDVLLCLSPFDPNDMSVGVAATVLDITERKFAQTENESISRISRLFLLNEKMSDIFDGITSILGNQFGFPAIGIARYDATADEVEYLGSVGIPWDRDGRPRFPASETLTGRVIKTGQAFVSMDVSDQRENLAPILRTMGVKTFICEPVVIGDTVFGAIALGDRRIRPEAARIARTIRIIADYLSRELSRRQIEDTLRESEELTVNLMASVNEGIVIFNRDFRVLLWNRFMEELSGIPAENVIGRTPPDLSPYIKNRAMLDDMRRALAGESFRSGDLEFEFARSGRKGWMIGQFTPLRNSQQEVIGIIVSIRDITRRRMAELSLGRTQEDLRETLDATTDGIWTWNAKGNEYYFSPRFYTMLGYKPEDFPATFPSFKTLIHPDDLERSIAVIKRFSRTEQPDIYENEFRLKTRDGSYRWIYSRARVVERDQEGRALRLIGNHEDITDRKIAEERLRGQLAVNMALSGLSGSIISQSYTITDIAIIVLEYAKLLTDSDDGYVSEISKDTGDNIILSTTIKLPDDHAMKAKKDHGGQSNGGDRHYGGLWGHSLNTRQAFFTNSPSDHPSWAVPPAGHPSIKRFLSVPVLFYSELVGQIALANAARDYNDNDIITVRRLGSLFAMAINRIRNENRLMQSLHEKEVLIKELHHRVKNNMQVISSLLGLQSRKVDDEKYRKYFEESQNRIHAMAMVHEKLYRADDMARVNFAEYINELARHLFYSYNINRQTVRLTIDVRDIFLGIDMAVPCAMIINELVTNAIKHAFPGGRSGELSVALVNTEDGKYHLTVSDNGVGLPEGVDINAMNTLGLQIVHSLTKQVRGVLTLDGTRGTRIDIIF
ncbi:MAG: PAS domain S-box protein [Spirochaetes bacterium]|nr:PAS domain S-box protein [Spirochaetota bacterium]